MLLLRSALALTLCLAAFCVAAEPSVWRATIESNCLDCHDADVQKGGMNLEALLDAPFADTHRGWERVLRQLDARQMPPVGKARPDEAAYLTAVATLGAELDTAAEGRPYPGRTDTVRRLTRFEYQCAVRDLLGIEVDASTLLPGDDASHGFDNVTLANLSPERFDRYIGAARKIARTALGMVSSPDIRTVQLPSDLTQEDHIPGLPIGTRGGLLLEHRFPRAGDYELRVFLARDRNELIEGMRESHDLEILLNDSVLTNFHLTPPRSTAAHTDFDDHLVLRFAAEAGEHRVGVTFPALPRSVDLTLREPYQSRFNLHRHPRSAPAIFQVTLTGPFGEAAPTASPRSGLLAELPADLDAAGEDTAVEQLLRRLMRTAYRRPISEPEFDRVHAFYLRARAAGQALDESVHGALSAILVSRHFLLRVESEPEGLPPGSAYPLDELALASRLSFFLWSSLPDDALLAAAEAGQLSDPAGLRAQARRMLQDERASALVENFADQWLYLRNLDGMTPDGRLFPDFDHNLREAFQQEAKHLVDTVIREDQSVLKLLRPDVIHLNERLAKHYGIPNVYGTRFRALPLGEVRQRGGILRQGGMLMVTSYATRTSPVLRGHWILENLLGTPPPPAPPDIPTLDEGSVSESLPLRDRLAAHRENPACASCHDIMDPIGFALEQFDAVGQWRDMEAGQPIDASGVLAKGGPISGVDELEAALLAAPDAFVRTLSEKLLTYALGRGIEPDDGPAVRGIVWGCLAEKGCFSALISEIVSSNPFRYRLTAVPQQEEPP